MSLVPITSGYTTVTSPVAQRPDWVGLMQPAADLASQIAGTDFVPEAFRNKPAQIAAAILYGAEIGLGPMQSLAKVDIVKGRPAPRAELARALALAAGHEIWVEESTNTRVTVCGNRRGSKHVMTVTWSLDDAKKAGIAGNPNYAKYPRQMLLARASAELVRAMCPDALGGITVFAEEAADIDDRDAPTVTPTATASATESPPGTRKRSRALRNADQDQPAVEGALAAKEADSASDGAGHTPARATGRAQPSPTPSPPSEDAAATDISDHLKPSPKQTAMAMATFAELDITDRNERLSATSALIGHPCASWKELTHDEASRVIDGLAKLKAGELAFEIQDDSTWVATAIGDELLDGGDDAA